MTLLSDRTENMLLGAMFVFILAAVYVSGITAGLELADDLESDAMVEAFTHLHTSS